MSDISVRWRKLRQDTGTLISEVDGKIEKLEAEEKRMEQKRDESYLKGAEDMRTAVNILLDTRAIGLTQQKLEELFGTVYIPNILGQFSAATIIDGLKRFLKEKEQEQDFHIGDEVECIDERCNCFKEKFVITKFFDLNNRKAIRLINLRNLSIRDTTCPEGYRKTGNKYDFIPFPKEEGGENV